MNADTIKTLSDSTESLKSPVLKTKVSSYTQVEPEYVRTEIRSIVGQENIGETYLSKRLQDLSLRKQNKGERPPLVGQASSSSNDSVSISDGKHDTGTENYEKVSPPYQGDCVEPFMDLQVDVGASGINLPRGNFASAPYLLNRDDYINQRPGGSSDQVSLVIQPLENIQDFSRIRSSSSASSVTSSRPLEWDSGADVGYNQVYIISGKTLDPGMSTIERMALACGTNLLTRSDPEGTTGPSGQPQPVASKNTMQSDFKLRSKLGYPNAESTPIVTSATSDASPETASEDLISPISLPSENIDTENVKKPLSSYSSEVEDGIKNEQQDYLGSQTLKSVTVINSKPKIPLFPEIINSLPKSCHQEIISRVGIDLSDSNLVGEGKYQSIDDHKSKQESDLLIKTASQKCNTPPKIKSLLLNDDVLVCNTGNKKLSSSLENISTVDSAQSDNKGQSNTLPRSQSQLHLHADKLVQKSIGNTNNCPKYNMALHSLIQYNKSASSSSIATVVHRRKDSPKHVFAQTSVLKQESVGIQVCENSGVSKTKMFIGMHFNDTPHLPKPISTEQFPKRSNYFNFDSSCNKDLNNESTGVSHNLRYAEENKIIPKEPMIHPYNGIPCTGAHRRVPCTSRLNKKPFLGDQEGHTSNNGITGNICSATPLSHSRPATQGSSNNVFTNKQVLGYGVVDSVESSAKSGGAWTDKHCCMTVEDRVNSFEYLPGHVYENAERQPPVDSRGTSSISIQNQTSNNESVDEQGRVWASSESISSSLEKDVQRGVDIISDFVNGSCANNTAMKKKLIRRVVQKLITKNYACDKTEPAELLLNNVPWVPPRPPNPIERNGRETRRSVNRSKVPCEFSSRSEKSGSTNASSECFIPCPAASNTFLPSSLRDNSCPAGQGSHSSTSEISIEKSSKNCGKPSHPSETSKAQVTQNHSVPKVLSGTSSSKSHNNDWREPVTKSEKLLEERLKAQSESSSSQSDAMTLAQYLNMERENQLFWIRSEIQHLNNLKGLLERQEELKRGVKDLKSKSQKTSEKPVLKDRNRDRADGVRESHTPQSKTSDIKAQNNHQPTLGAWLDKSATTGLKARAAGGASAGSTDGMDGWASHHYRNENTENLRSCMKRKSKHHQQNYDKRISSAGEQQGRPLYDEPPALSAREKREDTKVLRPPPTLHRQRVHNHEDDSVFVTDEGITKKNAQTETLDSVGVQTTPSVQQLPVVHPAWFTSQQPRKACACMCQVACKTCGDNTNIAASVNEDVKNKKTPVGYYITFEPSSAQRDMTTEQRPLEEVRIPVPMSEPKHRPARRQRAGGYDQDGERIRSAREAGGVNDIVESSSGTASSQGAKDEGVNRIHTGKPTFSGAAGMLQYYLLRNRPSYVSRAEDRRQCIVQMQYLRELRVHSKRRLLNLTEPATAAQLPPPPHLGVKRVFSQQSMRRQTERTYRQLSEVKGKQQDTKRKECYRTNRLMAEIFRKKLQKKVLKGEVNLSNSVSVISSL